MINYYKSTCGCRLGGGRGGGVGNMWVSGSSPVRDHQQHQQPHSQPASPHIGLCHIPVTPY